ncbi:hypothetical protein [Roseateles violae]|uniref:Uncharacterized protein n=1 Tax=Roseateles violae TaxID=3058042 RepID=A0ABT8DTT5_9BURK|nr:hypothetical protein [Pelomonas sp. PFR6]MDN3920314.1 hypothetical protein [Pelomonas sp. PFR6]
MKAKTTPQSRRCTSLGALAGAAVILCASEGAQGQILLGFEGPSQYDGASFGRSIIPPDAMGAVGLTQYVSTTNGAYAVYDKTTGSKLSMVSDLAFWAAAGQTGTNGETRIMYNAAASRWVAVSSGANSMDLQIAVSRTDNALGTWQSVKFQGYGGLGFGANASYPTLALDKSAIYVGTNDFAPATQGGVSFRGTTLNVIPLNSLFNAGPLTVANMRQFFTPCINSCLGGGTDRGYALQGVNSQAAGSSGKVVANSLFINDNVVFGIYGLTPSSAAGSTLTAPAYLGASLSSYGGPARQPSTTNPRVINALDQRISSSVYESQGKIFMLNTVDSGSDFARVHYTVIDANTNAILSEGDIGTGNFDYFQGSIAVNAAGQLASGAHHRKGLTVVVGDGTIE